MTSTLSTGGTTQLPIRALTLYKQGIGHFTRRGMVEDRVVTLVVPRGATNDLLKSLNIVVHEGGQVVSVDYETPEDKNKVMGDLSVRLADRASLVDLLVSLRGTQITLNLQNGETASGRLIGVDNSLNPSANPPVVVLQNADDAANVTVYPVAQVTGLRLHDDRALTDVGFFLDVSRVEQTRTTLTVRIAETQSQPRHDLEISYLAPSPVWRASYRLIADLNGRASLTVWGLFDNTLDEDLENVSLTLISGRPISFEYELYESRVPSRPVVSDNPMAIEAVAKDPHIAEAMAMLSHDFRTPLSSILGYAHLLAEISEDISDNERGMIEAIKTSAQLLTTMMDDLVRLGNVRGGNVAYNEATHYRSGPLGDLKVSGSYFTPLMLGNAEADAMTYAVETPVSVRRGRSAMVPLLNVRITYEPLCVYNGDKLPNHPLHVWRFQNTTGYALEQGPVTVEQAGRYLGEGLLRFSGVDDDIQIPYALEFGVLVSERSETHPSQLHSLEVDAAQRRVNISRAEITEYQYTLTSRVDRDIRVHLERRDPTRGEFYEMPAPDFSAEGYTRWAVNVPAQGETTFTVRVQRIHARPEDAATWGEKFVAELSAAGLLTPEQNTLLTDLLAEKDGVSSSQAQIGTLQKEAADIGTLQEGLRKNLAALGASERETAIREQILADLEVSENRRREIANQINALNERIRTAQNAQAALLDSLYGQAD